MIKKEEVINTFRAIGKMCKATKDLSCGSCPIYRLCAALTDDPLSDIPESLIAESAEILENWSEAHTKTYQQDLFEKFPKAKMINGCPDCCRASIYGTPIDCSEMNCLECWNEEMEEEL